MTAQTPIRGRLAGGLGQQFWRLWSASAASNLSDGIFFIALPLLAVSLTTSPALVAGVTVASRLPWLVFALIAGALADRLDRRRTMVFVQAGRVVLLGILVVAIVTGTASIGLVYLVAFLLGVLETLFDTAAQSMLPNVVERDRLTQANSRLHAAEQTMNGFVGPPIGGFLASAGLAFALLVPAIGYLGAGLGIASLRGTFRAARADGTVQRIDREIREGLAHVFHDPLLRTLVLAIAALNFGSGMFWAIFVLYAVEPGPMGLTEVGFGLLLAVAAVGSLAGTAAASWLETRIGKPNILLAAMIILAVQYTVMALTANPIMIAPFFGLSNLILTVFNVTYQSFRQRIVPDRLLGRIVASFRVIGWGILPLGAIVAGLIGEELGLTAVFVAAAVVTALVLPARLIITNQSVDAAEGRSHA